MKTFTISIFLLLFLLSSCDKENSIERNLWKKTTGWNIVAEEANFRYSNGTYESKLTLDRGTIRFHKDGTGKFEWLYNGEKTIEEFVYHNSVDKLFVIIDGKSYFYKMEWKKNNMKLIYNDDIMYYDPQLGQTITVYRTFKYFCEKQ